MAKPLPLLSWSPIGTTYPAGPNAWNLQPTNVPPAGTYFTPDVFPAAEEFNALFSTVTIDLNALDTWAGCGPAVNWYPEFTVSALGSDSVQNIAWDPIDRLWMVVSGFNTTTTHVYLSYGTNQGASGAWAVVGTPFTTSSVAAYSAVMADPTTQGVYWVIDTDNVGANNHFHIAQCVSGTWTLSPGAWTTATATGQYYGVEMTQLGANIIVACAGTSAGDSFLLTSNNGFNTWVSAASGPGGSNTIAPNGAGASACWYLKSNGAQALAIQNYTDYTVYNTTDGVLWTAEPGLTDIVAALNTVGGLCWTEDAFGPCWLVAFNSAAGTPFWCKSTDGIHWETQAGGVSTDMVVVDMAAIGSLIVCTLQDASSGGPSGQIYSPDGGVTWYPNQQIFTTNHTPVGRNKSRVISAAGELGFMSCNGIWMAFSHQAGTPANAL